MLKLLFPLSISMVREVEVLITKPQLCNACYVFHFSLSYALAIEQANTLLQPTSFKTSAHSIIVLPVVTISSTRITFLQFKFTFSPLLWRGVGGAEGPAVVVSSGKVISNASF